MLVAFAVVVTVFVTVTTTVAVAFAVVVRLSQCCFNCNVVAIDGDVAVSVSAVVAVFEISYWLVRNG